MAWYAVDPDGMENKFSIKPTLHNNGIITMYSTKGKGKRTILARGTIEKLLGCKLTWQHGPVEIK